MLNPSLLSRIPNRLLSLPYRAVCPGHLMVRDTPVSGHLVQKKGT